MTEEGTGGVRVDLVIQQFNDYRQAFWDRVHAQDREGTERVRRELIEYPKRSHFDINEYPVIANTWSDAFGETDLHLGFMEQGNIPLAVWEAKSEIERLSAPLRTLNDEFTRTGVWGTSLEHAGVLLNELTTFFAALDPELRRHPILLKALSEGKHGFFTVSESSAPSPSEDERADRKRRRMYQWSERSRDILYIAELTPPSEHAARSWVDDFLLTEQRIREMVETADERFVALYWELEEERLALLRSLGFKMVTVVFEQPPAT